MDIRAFSSQIWPDLCLNCNWHGRNTLIKTTEFHGRPWFESYGHVIPSQNGGKLEKGKTEIAYFMHKLFFNDSYPL